MSNKTEYMRIYRQEHREAIAAQNKRYKALHRKRLTQLELERRKRNLERYAFSEKAAAANKCYPGKLTARDVETVIDRSGRTCHWCGKTGLQGTDLTLEHLQPINHVDALAVACRKCNSSRRAVTGKQPSTEEQKRAEARVRHERWRRNNPEHVLSKGREYAEKNREKLKEYNRQYRLRRKAEAEARGEKYRG